MAQGLQNPNLRNGPLEAAGRRSLRSSHYKLIPLSNINKWEIRGSGIKNTFLRADASGREVHIRAPPEWNSRGPTDKVLTRTSAWPQKCSRCTIQHASWVFIGRNGDWQVHGGSLQGLFLSPDGCSAGAVVSHTGAWKVWKVAVHGNSDSGNVVCPCGYGLDPGLGFLRRGNANGVYGRTGNVANHSNHLRNRGPTSRFYVEELT